MIFSHYPDLVSISTFSSLFRAVTFGYISFSLLWFSIWDNNIVQEIVIKTIPKKKKFKKAKWLSEEVIFQERQRKLLNQEAGLRSKSFNNRKSFGLEQLLGAFWVQRNSEKRAGSWDCVARHYISFFLSFLTTMSLLQYFSPHLACTLLSVYRSIVNLQFCVSIKCTAR